MHFLLLDDLILTNSLFFGAADAQDVGSPQPSKKRLRRLVRRRLDPVAEECLHLLMGGGDIAVQAIPWRGKSCDVRLFFDRGSLQACLQGWGGIAAFGSTPEHAPLPELL